MAAVATVAAAMAGNGHGEEVCTADCWSSAIVWNTGTESTGGVEVGPGTAGAGKHLVTRGCGVGAAVTSLCWLAIPDGRIMVLVCTFCVSGRSFTGKAC